MLRIQYVVSDGSGRSVKWDERKAGDYSAAAAAFMAVAMGGDGFRRAVVRMAEDEFVGISGLLEPSSGELIGVADAPEAKPWGPFGPGPEGLRAKSDPPTIAEWVADDQNAHHVVADLRAERLPGDLTEDEAVARALARQQANPMVSRVELLELTEDRQGARLAVWREEDRLYEREGDDG